MEVVNESLKNPTKKSEIQEQAFKDALDGIREGQMSYKFDPLLPILQGEMNARISHFKGLSKEEESKLLSLTANQKRILADQDRK